MSTHNQRRWSFLVSTVMLLLMLLTFVSPALADPGPPPPMYNPAWFPIHQTDLADPVAVDGLVTYSIDVAIRAPIINTVQNGSDRYLGLVTWVIEDVLPAELDYVSSFPEGLYDAGQHVIRWELGQILNGSGRNVMVTLRPEPSAILVTTDVTNLAQFWAWQPWGPPQGNAQLDTNYVPEPVRTLVNQATETTTIVVGEPPALIPYSRILQQGKDGYAGNVDTYIDSNNAARNYAHTPWMYLKTVDNTSILSRFDLTGMPAGTQITAAKLRFYVGAIAPINAPITARLYAMLRTWDEDGATWLRAQSGAAWASPGANGAGDRAGLPGAEVGCYAPPCSPTRMVEFDVTTLAQEWLANPGSNLGVVVKASLCQGTALYYIFSADSRTSERRPELYLEFMAPPAP